MKVKEIKRTANVAWSPKQLYPIYLAAGTAAQQLDATFSTTAALEIYHVDLENKNLEMPVAGCMPSEHRFHKLLWTDHGLNTSDHPSGMILGGTDNGKIIVIDAATILSGDHELSVLDTLSDHTGPVQALDINKFQHNLIASGAADSEIFIWDLRNPETPLTPGTKTSPPDQISCLAWNNQVQHILASSSQTGRVVIWDLRKSEPIIKVGDQSAMFHYKSMAWHPDVATQILIANEDDRYPVIQMWDLRFATSPMKIFEGHTRGVLSLDWCPQDSDLLMSCGKDNRILCWNPNTQLQNGEIIYELPTSAQWTSDVRWCPRNPGLVSTTAFDGHITVSTLMGGSQQLQQDQQNQISDSFGIQPDASLPTQPTSLIIEPLKKPPKWMRTPCAARFSFGGKLISCENITDPGSPRKIHISQVVTEQDFLHRSNILETALLNGQLPEFCDTKIESESDPQEKLLWQFLKSNFHNEPRMQFLNLLGYNPEEIADKILSSSRKTVANSVGVNPEELASKIELLKANDQNVSGNECMPAVSEIKTPSTDIVDLNDSPPNDEHHDQRPTGSIAAESTPQDLFNAFPSDQLQSSEGSNLFDAIAENTLPEAEKSDANQVQEADGSAAVKKFSIPTDNEMDGLICQALLAGNFEIAVDVCFNNSRMADGLLLAIAGGPELFARTQKRYLDQSQCAVSKIISAIVNRDWRSIVENAAIENWKEALSTLVTYSRAEEFSELCCSLGKRLENEMGDYNSALLCYICAGDVEKMVACWSKSSDGANASPLMLQKMIEKMMVLKKSVENDQHNPVLPNDSHVAQQLSKYAELLSSQGNLQNALVYLSVINGEGVAILKDRVFKAHGGLSGHAPQFPFQKVEVQGQQIQQKPVTPIQDKGHSPSYSAPSYPTQHAGISQFSPQPARSQHADQYNAPSSYYSPQPSYNPSTSQSNFYNPMPPQQNNYQQMDQVSRPASLPSQPPTMHPQYTSNVPNQPSPTLQTMYNPSMSTHSPVGAPPPQVFHPEANTRPNPAPPSNDNINLQPNMMKPSAPPPGGNPPPSGGSSIMSMKAVKGETGLKKTPHSPMNFYDPSSIQQHNQPHELNGHAPNAIPNLSHGSTLPPAQTVPPQPPKKEPLPPKAEKIRLPIPSEHVIIQQTFDGMVEKCKEVTSNPQAKRKLEDVRRKLDVLYDLLGENRVSPSVLKGLHEICQACQTADYMTGIRTHTQMLTTGSFSEISSFMPGLKSLMQISGQLKV